MKIHSLYDINSSAASGAPNVLPYLPRELPMWAEWEMLFIFSFGRQCTLGLSADCAIWQTDFWWHPHCWVAIILVLDLDWVTHVFDQLLVLILRIFPEFSYCICKEKKCCWPFQFYKDQVIRHCSHPLTGESRWKGKKRKYCVLWLSAPRWLRYTSKEKFPWS